jgi:hypothetical protein
MRRVLFILKQMYCTHYVMQTPSLKFNRITYFKGDRQQQWLSEEVIVLS